MLESVDGLIGQNGVRRTVEGFLKQNRLPHTLLFWGPPGVGKFTYSLILASQLNGDRERIFRNIYPDVMVVFPNFKGVEREEVFQMRREGRYYKLRDKQGNILIDEIREIKRVSALTPYEGKWKVFIIAQAERMTVEAMNAFLKVLEEPGPENLFILITTDPSLLPETIVSRAVNLRFKPLSQNELKQVLQNMGIEIDEDFLTLSRGVEDYLFLKENVDLVEKVDKLFFNKSPEERLVENPDDLDTEGVLKALLFLLDKKREKLGIEEVERIMDVIKRAYEFLRSNIKPENVMRFLILEV
ncbi:MAG TPA: DNA polymerase III subunit delta' [candidate division WOR-3 bacterium]|uniref:DNA polymerase III subunit delta n=1 Tax=candidate division WOR-3 bacterium TaxID=2052148 RepID=A0A7C0ZD75_UNCW3|nr:DNA polymerase III subunit delta' [candidate division WOR-3 bacterium]